jgi:hypothetical protein
LYLSFNNLITHFVPKTNFLYQEIGNGTPCNFPPILYGKIKTFGDIFIKDKKNK